MSGVERPVSPDDRDDGVRISGKISVGVERSAIPPRNRKSAVSTWNVCGSRGAKRTLPMMVCLEQMTRDHRTGEDGRSSVQMRTNSDAACGGAWRILRGKHDGPLYLGEGANLDLPDTFAGDGQFAGQPVERDRA